MEPIKRGEKWTNRKRLGMDRSERSTKQASQSIKGEMNANRVERERLGLKSKRAFPVGNTEGRY